MCGAGKWAGGLGSGFLSGLDTIFNIAFGVIALATAVGVAFIARELWRKRLARRATLRIEDEF